MFNWVITMNSNLYAFLITTLAGISTIIGFFVIFIKRKSYNKIIVSSLSFASGVMICTSITDLIPESIILINNKLSSLGTTILCFLGILFGITISMIIDYYVPDIGNINNKSLFRVGIISLLAIVLHNIPEGIATFMASSNNIKLGISLAIAIAMHNIPEGITISVPIYYSTGNKKTAFLYTLISALSEPLGAILCYLFLRRVMTNLMLGIILSIVAGIMLEISFRVLLPSTKKYNDKYHVILFFIIGFIFMLVRFIL